MLDPPILGMGFFTLNFYTLTLEHPKRIRSTFVSKYIYFENQPLIQIIQFIVLLLFTVFVVCKPFFIHHWTAIHTFLGRTVAIEVVELLHSLLTRFLLLCDQNALGQTPFSLHEFIKMFNASSHMMTSGPKALFSKHNLIPRQLELGKTWCHLFINVMCSEERVIHIPRDWKNHV